MSQTQRVDYQTQPSQYRHWKLKFEGPVATLAADFNEDAGLRPGYKLKLNRRKRLRPSSRSSSLP